MTNFKKRSRFDEWDRPPETDYRNWKQEDTRVITVDTCTEDMSYEAAKEFVEKNHGPILEEISGPTFTVKACFRVYKPGRKPVAT